MFDAVLDALSWKGATRFYEALDRGYLDRLSTRFDATIAAFVKAGVGARLAARARALSDEGRSRLVTAPESARRLLREAPTDLVFFHGAVLAELRRAGLDDAEESAWTALGDHYYPAGRIDRRPGASARWEPHRRYDAPRLAIGVPVDGPSRFADRKLAPFLEGTVCPGPEELARSVQKLDVAARGVAAASEEARAIVAAFTRAIVIRSDPTENERLTSFSTEHYIGRVGFSNLDARAVSPARVADSLVHEAIHSLIYVVELARPLLAARLVDDPAATLTIRVASPWTGRSLDVHSFAHACFVWFGLAGFWRRAIEAGVFHEDAPRLLAEATCGFESASLPAALASAVPHLSADGRAALDALVRRARAGALG